MAVSLVGSVASASSGGPGVTVTFSQTATAGNLLLLWVSTRNTTTGYTFTNHSWTLIESFFDSPSNSDGALYYRVATGGESSETVTVVSAGRPAVGVIELTGAATTGIPEVSDSTEYPTPAALSWSTPSVAPLTVDGFALALWFWERYSHWDLNRTGPDGGFTGYDPGGNFDGGWVAGYRQYTTTAALQSTVSTEENGAVDTALYLFAPTATGGESGDITGAAIAGGTFAAKRARTGAISGAALADGTLSARRDRLGAITGSALAGGTFDARRTRLGELQGDGLADGTVDARRNRLGTLQGDGLAAGTLDARRDRLGALQGDGLAGGTFTGLKPDENVGAITGAAIAGGTFDAIRARAGTHQGDAVAGGTFSRAAQNAASIQGDAIAGGTFEARRARVGTLQGDAIAGGTFAAATTEKAGDLVGAAIAGGTFDAVRRRRGTLQGAAVAAGRFDAYGGTLALSGKPSVRPALSGTVSVNP